MAHSSDASINFRPATLRGTAGYFRVGQTDTGGWWLIEPEGRPVFLRAVNGVRGVADALHEPAARLRTWGFNALGADADPGLREEGLPFVAAVNFSAVSAHLAAGGARVPDIFDPAWPKMAALHAAEVCRPLATHRALIGWLTDDLPGWAQAVPAGGVSLLQVCLSLEPSFAAYHAAWEFVLALHGGRLEAVAKAWNHPLANKEVVRELTRAEQGLATRGYQRDDARWSQEFARRYFALASAALRAHDPHHLILGCRVAGRASPAVLAECAPPAVDLPWIDLDDLPQVPGGPVLAGNFSWVDPRFLGTPGVRRARGLTTVERMLRRGRTVLERAARHPAIVGYAWERWRDRAGEQPPFAGGLVHDDDVEAREHTELLADINARAEEGRRQKAEG